MKGLVISTTTGPGVNENEQIDTLIRQTECSGPELLKLTGSHYMSDSIGHEMLNHLGRRITVTARKLRQLDMENWLKRDRESGLLKFKSELFTLYFSYGPDHELGPDMSGPNVCKCRCGECATKIDTGDTRIKDIRTRQIVRDATAHRRYA